MTTLSSGAMATKKPSVMTYVSDEVNRALDREALLQRRSRSQMAALLIEEALKARGHQFSDPTAESTPTAELTESD